MYAIIRGILSLIIPAMMHMSAVGPVQVDPDIAATEFLDGLAAGDETVVVKYEDNEYVNMLENTGDDEIRDQLYKSLFHDFSYEMVDFATKNDVAVAKLVVTNRDFSKVGKAYEEEAYEYITANLYDDDVTSKKKLAAKCLDIYVDEIEKASQKNKVKENTIYLPLRSNGYYGWEVLVDDKIMKDILGGLKIPESK